MVDVPRPEVALLAYVFVHMVLGRHMFYIHTHFLVSFANAVTIRVISQYAHRTTT